MLDAHVIHDLMETYCMPPVEKKKKPWLKTQPMMRKVEYALMPVLLGAIYFFGWRSLAMVIWVAIVGCATEYLMAKKRGDQVSEAVFVTSLLLGLSLPPTMPFWQAAVGAVVAILFGKEVFGGFPRNVFNPAIVGRGFLYICFPTDMTSKFTAVWNGIP
ncbi:MAG: RnfABCDGE type electron transport complex subunit D, partial [Kiritimatiellaceae bacterium]|nr:RnfABCDGE type electron transport complex subunit D [Kiritimatiellaceae bacterium]